MDILNHGFPCRQQGPLWEGGVYPNPSGPWTQNSLTARDARTEGRPWLQRRPGRPSTRSCPLRPTLRRRPGARGLRDDPGDERGDRAADTGRTEAGSRHD